MIMDFIQGNIKEPGVLGKDVSVKGNRLLTPFRHPQHNKIF